MSQLDDLQAYTNANMPLRSIHWRWDNPDVAYDGDPNDGGAPTILDLSPPGTKYLQSNNTRWLKNIDGSWSMDATSTADSPKLATQEAFVITVDSGGTDPNPALRVTSQAEANAHGNFLTVGGALGALYSILLKHRVTIQLPSGPWTLAAGELDQIWRIMPAPIFGWISLRGADGWAQVAGTSDVSAVSSDGAGNVTLATDPAPAVDTKAYYLYVVSGKGAGQYQAIRSDVGINYVVATAFSPTLDGTSVVRVAEAPTTLRFNELTPTFRGQLTSSWTWHISFKHLNLETIPAFGWIAVQNINIHFGFGTRFVDIGIETYLTTLSLGDVSFDVRNFGWVAAHVITGTINFGIINPVGTAYFLANGTSLPAVRVQGGGMRFQGFNAPSSLGIGTSCLIRGAVVFDGWVGPYIEATGGSGYVGMALTSASQLKSDQGGSVAVQLLNGAQARIDDFTPLLTSTFKGVSVDVKLDGDDLLWSEIEADPDKSMMNVRGSTIMEGE
jgi:hypothetical protein